LEFIAGEDDSAKRFIKSIENALKELGRYISGAHILSCFISLEGTKGIFLGISVNGKKELMPFGYPLPISELINSQVLTHNSGDVEEMAISLSGGDDIESDVYHGFI